ncbi:uncharacterized protein LOC121992811 [Zingiber officinale]|uniref:Uncharacterized protein n=1 Tax=Zingiber officinale TaxID=94328 RepID=A0A8J5KUA6_ZINOF|nr:uncharacterized protein LOC121992811 [Zingiber officinale]KAG6496239.1 hypothetical protein ZIOFF_044097 [Zingiber officinale]
MAAAAMLEAERSRSLRFRAPPPTPIATGKGLRSSAVDDRLLMEYLEVSLRVPDLSLPDLYFPVQSPLKAPEEVDLPSLLAGDDSAVRRVLSAAAEVGAVRVTGVDAALIQGAKEAIEAGGSLFALPEQEKSRVSLFGRRDGVCDEFYWHRLPSPETEQLLRKILPDSYRTLRIKMENISARMETIAECITKILFKGATSQTTSRRFDIVQPVLCLRKYESPHQNDTRDLTDADSLLSYALCLHICAHDENFCIRRPEGSSIFKMSAWDVLVTIGKPFQDWCNGEFKTALGQRIFRPTDDPTQSFSLEYMCSPQVLSPEPDYGAKPVSLMDQILVVIVLAILYKVWLCIFS